MNECGECAAGLAITDARLWILHIFELFTYAYLCLMARHAWTATRGLPLFGASDAKVSDDDLPNRARWLATLGWGVIFGVVIEWSLTGSSSYVYNQSFLVMLPNPFCNEKPVPLCIGVGWGVFLYATTWTSQRLKLRAFERALLAGLLAVSIDLSLDPAAHLFGFWRWPNCENYPPYFGVPFDNFIGWFLIISIYSGLVRAGFRCIGDWPLAFVWLPAIAGVIALKLVEKLDAGLQEIYPYFGGDVIVFLIVFGVVLGLVVNQGRKRVATPLDPSWPVLALPVVYPALCWVLLLARGTHKDMESAALLLALPLSMSIAFLSFAWGCGGVLSRKKAAKPS